MKAKHQSGPFFGRKKLELRLQLLQAHGALLTPLEKVLLCLSVCLSMTQCSYRSDVRKLALFLLPYFGDLPPDLAQSFCRNHLACALLSCSSCSLYICF